MSFMLVVTGVLPVFAEGEPEESIPAVQEEVVSVEENVNEEPQEEIKEEPQEEVKEEVREEPQEEVKEEPQEEVEEDAEAVTDEDVKEEKEEVVPLRKAPEKIPTISSVTLSCKKYRYLTISWKAVDTDSVKVEMSYDKDFKKVSSRSIYSASPNTIECYMSGAWAPVYVRVFPITGNRTGEAKTASINMFNGYEPKSVKLANPKLEKGASYLGQSVYAKNGQKVPSCYYTVVKPKTEVIGLNTGYIKFQNDYAKFANLKFTYTVVPNTPTQYYPYEVDKTKFTVYLDMSKIGKDYNYAEILYSTDKNFKTLKAAKIASKAQAKKTITGLKSNTVYYVRAQYVKKVGNKVYKSFYRQITIRTAGNPPAATYGSKTTVAILNLAKKNKSFVFKFPTPLSIKDGHNYARSLAYAFPQYVGRYDAVLISTDGAATSMRFYYNKTKAAKAIKLQAKINSITKYARTKGSYREQVKYVNWRMKQMSTYDWATYRKTKVNMDSYTAYGCLVNGKAVCSGYAEAFNAVMTELRIPTQVVQNSVHAWNKVKIGGKWYHVDVTWNDCLNNNQYLLTTSH